MVRKLIFSLLIITLITLPLLAGCNGDETTPSPTTQPTATASTPTPTAAGDWWDEFGEPQYGGKLNIWVNTNSMAKFDPAQFPGVIGGIWETLFGRDWAVDRDICDFKTEFVPAEYYKDSLAESWEYIDPTTVAVHLYEGITWQDKAPLNGREFTAEDVQYTYDRILGTGNGFTEKNPVYASTMQNIERVVATDKYTVHFELKNPSYFSLYEVFDGGFFAVYMVAREWVEQVDTNNWENTLGTGPYMLTDYTMGVATKYVRNPDYWKQDERHPDNQLPYIDEINEVVIPDLSTAMAALRSGQIDIMMQMNSIFAPQADSLAKTNPEIQQAWWPVPGYALEMRVDTEPFTDIRVRKALQMSIDRQTVADTHYAGQVDGAAAGPIYPGFEGWTIPYDDWTADLQAEYSFDQDTARDLLAEAGYPNGFETYALARSGQDLDLLQIVKSYFMDVGVDMEIETVADMATLSNLASTGMFDRMIYTAATAMPRPPKDAIIRRTPNDRENYTRCNDSQYNALVEQALAATTLEETKQLCTEIDMYALSQHWTVQILPSVCAVAWQPWVKGCSGEQLVAGAYFYHSRWWIDEDLR